MRKSTIGALVLASSVAVGAISLYSVDRFFGVADTEQNIPTTIDWSKYNTSSISEERNYRKGERKSSVFRVSGAKPMPVDIEYKGLDEHGDLSLVINGKPIKTRIGLVELVDRNAGDRGLYARPTRLEADGNLLTLKLLNYYPTSISEPTQ